MRVKIRQLWAQQGVGMAPRFCVHSILPPRTLELQPPDSLRVDEGSSAGIVGDLKEGCAEQRTQVVC